MDNWIKIADFSVGGFIWAGFSKVQTNKLICISSEYGAIVNCDTGKIEKCESDYDEEKYIAICDDLENEEIDIYGQYGGMPILKTQYGESISIKTQEELYGSKVVKRYKINFETTDTNMEIYNNYGYYVCSFSPCGNYFVFAQDAGVTVYKRK